MNSLSDVRGFLIDLDGVLYVDQTPIHGAVDAVNTLKGHGMPCRFLTNTSTLSRASICTKLRGMGFDITQEEIFSAPQAVLSYLQQKPHAVCKLYVSDDVRPDFAHIQQTQGLPTHIVIGDIGPHWDYALLNHILNDLLNGAELVAIHKNKFWQTEAGLQIDIGGFIAALEYASNKPARVMGKPSRDFFDLAAHDLSVPKSAVAVIGDDVDTDVLGAQRAGLSGILCKTGKFREEYFANSNVKPDYILDSIRYLPYLLTKLERVRQDA
jgi:HAD superfamily hydrolase (TIGR01458 family)